MSAEIIGFPHPTPDAPTEMEEMRRFGNLLGEFSCEYRQSSPSRRADICLALRALLRGIGSTA
jgi:hypothetical protein